MIAALVYNNTFHCLVVKFYVIFLLMKEENCKIIFFQIWSVYIVSPSLNYILITTL